MLSEERMIEILEEIAESDSNRSAQIAAIKELRSIRGGNEPVSDEFQGLYEVGKPAKTRRTG